MAEVILTRRATLAPSSLDPEGMTVEATISTFADVQRAGFVERLDPAGLDSSRLIGAPVLDGHAQGSVTSVIGVVQSFRMEGLALVAVIRLSAASDAASSVLKIREGILRNLSIGYVVPAWAESTDSKTGKRVKTARAFQIREVSVVPVPADPGAVFRSEEMPEDLIETPAAPTPAENRAAIRTIARSAGMTTEQADDMVDRDLTTMEARAEAFEAMQTRGRQTPRIRTVASHEDPAITMQHRAEALFARMSGTAPSESARPFMADSLRDHARAALESAGTSTRGMDADTIIRAAMHSTSEFPGFLTGAGNRMLMAGYQAAQSPIKTILARQTTTTDFRTTTKLKLSDVGILEEVSESGEVKSTTRGEAAESYAVKTYATQFAISRKALINDDLGAFRDWGATAGRMAAETEANILLNLLLSNPVMGEDGLPLFHATHGNLAAGAALSVATLDAARRAMRTMKGLDGRTPINAVPMYLVVGPARELLAEQTLAAIYAATVATTNPFSGKLTLLVEPRITDNRFYVFTDPAVLPVLEYAYLSSAQGPQMASREGWDVLGMEFRVVLDFGCGAIDWRGAYLNPGAQGHADPAGPKGL